MTQIIDQIRRDLRTDTVVVPSKRKRYASYAVAFLGASLVAYSTRDIRSLDLLAGLIMLFGSLAWFMRKMYEYLQVGEPHDET